MYIPEHFQEVSRTEIEGILAQAPLACIVAMSSAGLIANHIPLLAGAGGRLIGHIALANDLHRVIESGSEVLVIFRGADGYVSPNFYPSKAEHHRVVPTWNYQVVHIHGRISFQHDTQAKRAAVGLLTRSHERRLNGPEAWKMADAPADYIDVQLSNIVALQITTDRVLAKSKLSQNRAADDVQGAVEGLQSSGQTEIAAAMRRRLPDA